MVLLIAIGISAVLYAAAAWAVARLQRQSQFSPTHRDLQGLGNSRFQPWRTASGEFLGYFRPTAEPRRIVVFFHGAGGEALDRAWVDEITPAGDLLILAEYPGFGARAGSIRDKRWVAEAERLVEEARDRWGDVPILAVGENLGCSVAAQLAARGKVERLAMISPFPSGGALTPKVYRFFPAGWSMRDRFAVEEPLRSVKAPLHIVHGTLDERVPLEQGRAVFRAYTGAQKHIEEVPGFDHSNIDQALLHSPFTLRFREFLTQ